MELFNGVTGRMLNEQFCKADRSFNTTYNSDKNVPPFVGIMFEISSFIDIEISTFEIDIRWDMKPTDLSIQVFTIDGPFADRFNQSNAWDILASTEIIPAPEGNSGVIPASEFKPVSIKALEVRSFYITMTGPYIDHSVYGLQKTGDVHTKGDDIQLYVGSGFTSNNFPGEIDKVLDPQFAGIVYYKKAYQCDDNQAKSTTITFQFLLDAKGIDDSFVLSYNAAIDAAIDQFMATTESMQTFIKDFGLHKSTGATTVKEGFNGDCPEDWKECAPIILRSNFRFSHTNALETRKVQYVLYSADTATKVIDTVRDTLSPDKNVANVGIESTSAQIWIRIKGPPLGEIIDDVQIRYFEDTTQRFLDRFTGSVAIFGVTSLEVPGQSETRKLRRHLMEETDSNGTISFKFEVNGAYPVGTSIGDFIEAIDTACQAQRDVFVSLLKNSGIRPGDISDGDRIDYFQGIKSISCEINQAYQAPTVAAAATGSALVRNVVIGIIISLCVCVATIYWMWQIRSRRKKSEEEAKYREERREERRLRRLERSNQDLSVQSFDSQHGKDCESDLESIKQSAVDGLLNKKKFKSSSDSTSSISISLHSLDLDSSPRQSNKAYNPNTSSRSEYKGKSKLDVISNLIFHSSNRSGGPSDLQNQTTKRPPKPTIQLNKQTPSRSKSLSPNLQTKRKFYPKSLGSSLDLSLIDYNTEKSDDGLQQHKQRSNVPGPLSKFIDKQPKRQPEFSRGCVTVSMPISKPSIHTADRSAASEEVYQTSINQRAKYRPPPISQHRNPSLRRIDTKKPKRLSSSRSLDGLPPQKRCGPSRIPRSANVANSNPTISCTSDKMDYRSGQTTRILKGDERLHRSFDLSDIDISHDVSSADREPSRKINQSAIPALHQSLDLSNVDFSHNHGSNRRDTQIRNSVLHRSLDLSSEAVSKNNPKVNSGVKQKMDQVANSVSHRGLELRDVDASVNQDHASREPKPNWRNESKLPRAPHQTFRANERFHRSLDLTDLVASDNHAVVNVSNKLSLASRVPKTIEKEAVKPSFHRSMSDVNISRNMSKDTRVPIRNMRPAANPVLSRSFDSREPIRKPKTSEHQERLDLKSSLSRSDHGSARDFRKKPVPRTNSGNGTTIPIHQIRPVRQPVTPTTKTSEVQDHSRRLKDSNQQFISANNGHNPPPPPPKISPS